MKKHSLLLLLLLLSAPAQAQDKAHPAQVRNMVQILFPEELYVGEQKRLKAQYVSLLNERFNACVKPDSALEKEVQATIDSLLSYDRMVERLTPMFEELGSAEIVQILEFYDTEAGQKWARIAARLEEEASRAGAEMGQNFAQEVLPVLIQDEACAPEVQKLLKTNVTVTDEKKGE